MFPFPVSLCFSMKVLSFLSSWGGLDKIQPGDQSQQVSLPSKTNQTLSFSKTWRICDNAHMPSPLTSVPPWIGHPLCLYLCILRSSSEAVILFLHGQTFPGIFAASCLHTWRNCESLSWVMCVYPPQATEVTPSRHWQRGQHLRVAISKVARLGERPHCLCCLSAIWPRSGWRGVGWRGGGGTYWQGPAMFSEAQSSGSIAQYDAEKCLLLMKASSVSRIGLQPERHYVTEIP